jgi:hypothetical protein
MVGIAGLPPNLQVPRSNRGEDAIRIKLLT